MKASKKGASKAGPGTDIHISGAEGIYGEDEITGISADYVSRVLDHPRGKPDTIVITLESIQERPAKAPLLIVRTEECRSPESARDIIIRYISALGISDRALAAALKVLRSKKTMRGASLISAQSGKRLEPDRTRGIRVSRLGIDKSSDKRLRRRLATLKIDNTTVKEALILASKVASCKDIMAEICISDDPDYTTGYVASQATGYLRIPNIKRHGEMHGGRVFFLRRNADIGKTIDYLEKRAVIMETKNG
jgi:6-carboxyhexanoate--CoA ligase